ncbi:MAG TPA: hypothetical protein VFV87_11145, partial [Pirellulaceae bacterium]|nr:hypothetical protein [Pirellulaceae bacterium]
MCSRESRVDFAWRLVLILASLLATARIGGADDWPLADRTSHLPQPWIVVRLSAELFEPLVEQPIDETVPVEELILGTQVAGQAHVAGRPELVLAEDATSAAFTVRLAGTIKSQTTGRMGPITIFGGAETSFTASKRVVFDPAGGFVGQRPAIEVQTNVATDRIQSRRGGPVGRALERVAWSRVESTKDEVAAIVREKTECQLGAEFDRMLEERLALLNRAASLRHLAELLVGGPDRVQYVCCTTPRGLQIAALVGSGQPAEAARRLALGAPRAFGLPVTVCVHESMVSQRAATALRWLDIGRRMVDLPGPLHLPGTRQLDGPPLAV